MDLFVEPDRSGGRLRRRSSRPCILLAVEHHASNNLGSQAAQLLGRSALEAGSYRNHFHAAPAAAKLVPRAIRKPIASGLQTALVVGVAGEALSTERDHRVKVQFPWQRGERPLAGGLPHDERSADAQGNASGNERSGTWVRVAQAAAGANWGAEAVPRIGSEVVIDFIEGDIDRPVIVGALYDGADNPPFAAGEDSGVNHPGVISGVHSHALDGAGWNPWVIDDAGGTGATAHPLHAHDDAKALDKLLEQIDPNRQGRHDGSVNGQEANKAGCRTLTQPVEAFASPLVLTDTPSTAAWPSEAADVEVVFARESTLMDIAKPRVDLLTVAIKPEAVYIRAFVDPENRLRWTESLPKALETVTSARAQKEAELRARGVKIDEANEDPRVPVFKSC